MVTSDFRPEVEIRPFRACAMKSTQYNAYLWPNSRSFRIFEEIGVEENDGDVRFYTGSENIALSCMRHASGHNYRNSSFIVEVAMGQNVFLVDYKADLTGIGSRSFINNYD